MHHAHLIVGEFEEAERLFDSFISELGLVRAGNPDFFLFAEETFGVDDARQLSTLVGKKSFGREGKKVFFVRPSRFTLEAQNALLKTLEEPSEGTFIFLVAREREQLIPTLLSRLMVVEARGGGESEEAKEFVDMSLGKRLKFAQKFAENRAGLAPFLDNLLFYLRESGASSVSLGRVAGLRLYADLPSASGRLILEHLAFVI